MLQALLDARNISAIACDLRQEQLPIYRLLLAFLYRAHEEALKNNLDAMSLRKLWGHIWSQGEFNASIIHRYAQVTKENWHLLDSRRPFYQVPGLEYASDKDYDPIESALPDMPAKHEKFLFSMRAENTVTSIPLDAAARLLVYLQGYDISGIHTPAKGSTTARHGKEYPPHGMMGTGLLGALGGVYAQGSNLFETLMLNWVLVHNDKPLLVRSGAEQANDLAPWDVGYRVPSPLMDTGHPATGVVRELTWQSRRILLIPTEDGSAVKGIRTCFGDIPHVLNFDHLEMMTVWRDSSVQAKRNHRPRALMPDQHDPTEYEWQGLASLLTQRLARSGGKKNGITVRVPAPGVVEWIGNIRDSAESGDITLGTHELPAIVTFHAEGIQYGAQSAVVSAGIDDALELDAGLFGDNGANKQYVTAVIDLVDQSKQSVFALTRFVRDLQVVSGSKNPDNKKETVKETAYHELDQVFRRRLRSIPSPRESEKFLREWRDEIHRLVLSLADMYREQNDASVFAIRVEKGRSGAGDTEMSSSRADFYLRHSLNEALGRLPQTRSVSIAVGKSDREEAESEVTA